MASSNPIKETLEVIDFIKALAGAIKEASSDGSLNLFDLIYAIKLCPKIVDAIKDSDDIGKELLNLDPKSKTFLLQEMQDAMFMIVKAIKIV